MAAHRAEFISALREELRERLAVDESSTVGTRGEMPNGYQLRFRAGLQVDQMSEIARVYAAIANAKHEMKSKISPGRRVQLLWSRA